MADTDTAEKPGVLENARQTAGETIENLGENPLALVLGGLAIGVIVGALIPRLAKERQLLAPLGKRIASSATAAVEAAKETGKSELGALLPDRQATKDRVGALFGNVVGAAKDAAKGNP